MSSINWIRLGKELAAMPNGIAVLRVLQAHGVTSLVTYNTTRTPTDIGENKHVHQSCSINMVIDYAHKERAS